MDLDRIRELFNNTAEKYDRQRRCFIPCFDDFYVRAVSFLKNCETDFRNIVDLGAGTGLLTKVIYEMYPNANYTLIDISEDMLTIAKERFKGMDNFTFLEYNYVDDIPADNCDLICSALSIHHLDHKDKERLYGNIYSKLTGKGCFINLDQFNAKSEKINSLYDTWWYDYISNSGITREEEGRWTERRKLDRENTIDETVKSLEKSGFGNVECIYSFMKFGVIIAIK
jgi:ubiquinone/menaquinone biosynthesis C-methylase UbiE